MISSKLNLGCTSLGSAQASIKASSKKRKHAYPDSDKYVNYKKRDLKKIKRLFEEEPTLYDNIKYGNNWVRIGNTTFNGISSKEIDSIMLDVIEKQDNRKEEE